VRTVLLAEDDPWVRALVRDVLAEDGFRVLEAWDGHDAIRMEAEHPGPIHLLLTDVMMGSMNGCELAATLAARRPGMRVLFMSAYDRPFLIDRGLDPNAPLLTKPFTVEHLMRRVLAVLGGERARTWARARQAGG
jgi:DNA-binding response OmpR family regulator